MGWTGEWCEWTTVNVPVLTQSPAESIYLTGNKVEIRVYFLRAISVAATSNVALESLIVLLKLKKLTLDSFIY